GTVCVVGKMRDLILQLSKSSIYSTKPLLSETFAIQRGNYRTWQSPYFYLSVISFGFIVFTAGLSFCL
ncbi:hypothetical protein NL400_20010, partial [Klebsiella pneumoniae]|nr:hypothetical protein [Klebsiella pneumoniae]